MKRQRVILAVLVLIASAACAVHAQRGRGGQWVLLGQRNVSDGVDHDTVSVTAERGQFTAIKFEVQRHAVDFHRVVVHYRNGGDQNVELRNTIRAGGESRVVDLSGDDRVIRSIDFWYDAKTLGRGQSATVRVLGRR